LNGFSKNDRKSDWYVSQTDDIIYARRHRFCQSSGVNAWYGCQRCKRWF